MQTICCTGELLHDMRHVFAGGEWEWAPTTEQLDKSMLMARDPILFYDEIPLYESELDDNGVSQLLVKVPLQTLPHALYAPSCRKACNS